MLDGRLNKCRECVLEYGSAYQGSHPELKRKHISRYREKYPEKYKAQNAVNNAIRLGKIERRKCEVCGQSKSQAHHHKGYDLTNWLEVRWLCSRHHVAAHKGEI